DTKAVQPPCLGRGRITHLAQHITYGPLHSARKGAGSGEIEAVEVVQARNVEQSRQVGAHRRRRFAGDERNGRGSARVLVERELDRQRGITQGGRYDPGGSEQAQITVREL